jgi:hypothetical protein
MATTPIPTTTNTTAAGVDSAISAAVTAAEGLVDTAAETALDTAVPFFAVPVVKQVTDFVIEDVVRDLGDDVSISLQQVGTFVVIDTQVSGEKSGISQALANLMIAEKSGNAQQIQAAIAAYQESQSALQNDDGSSPITA